MICYNLTNSLTIYVVLYVLELVALPHNDYYVVIEYSDMNRCPD